MADSNITKRALAESFKILIHKKTYSKISISDICEGCDMCRKSFYYHFKDKEDLVDWIFVNEFVQENDDANYLSLLGWLEKMVWYLYANRSFYKKAFSLEGQNSFFSYFYATLRPILKKRLENMMLPATVTDIQVDFFTDAIAYSIKRWITSSKCAEPDDFVSQLRGCLDIIAVRLITEK